MQENLDFWNLKRIVVGFNIPMSPQFKNEAV